MIGAGEEEMAFGIQAVAQAADAFHRLILQRQELVKSPVLAQNLCNTLRYMMWISIGIGG